MLKRTLSGTVFVAVLVAFFLLRQFVDYRLFQILICFAMSVSTYEVASVMKKYSFKFMRIFCIVFGIAILPIYCLFNYLIIPSFGWLVVLGVILITLIVFSIFSFFKNVDFKKYIASILPLVYPALLLLAMMLANDLPNPKGFLALLLIFVISSLSDTSAYLVGMTYSKIRGGKAKKMCPKLSPNKTWAGGIGGIVGGVLGAILVYFIFKNLADTVLFFSPLLLFVVVGVLGSISTEIGDLLESFIKRKVGIKDMGKIMPGHGGIMDRIDGISLTSVVVFFAFLFV